MLDDDDVSEEVSGTFSADNAAASQDNAGGDSSDDEPIIHFRRPKGCKKACVGEISVHKSSDSSKQRQGTNSNSQEVLKTRKRLRSQKQKNNIQNCQGDKGRLKKNVKNRRKRLKLGRDHSAPIQLDSTSESSCSGDESQKKEIVHSAQKKSCGRKRSSPKEKTILSDDLAPQRENKDSVHTGQLKEVSELYVNVLSEPKDILTNFLQQDAGRRLRGHIEHIQGTKRKYPTIIDSQTKPFICEVVNSSNIYSFEVMLVSVHALRCSSPHVIRALFDYENPDDAGCRMILGPWLQEAKRRMENRRKTAEGRSMIRETEDKKRTEEEVLCEMMRLIRAAVGLTSKGQQDPSIIHRSFGLNFVQLVNTVGIKLFVSIKPLFCCKSRLTALSTSTFFSLVTVACLFSGSKDTICCQMLFDYQNVSAQDYED